MSNKFKQGFAKLMPLSMITIMVSSLFLFFAVQQPTVTPVFAAAPAGTMTASSLAMNISETFAINDITVVDSGGEITTANGIKIVLPSGLTNTAWDITDTTATIDVSGNTTGAVSTTVSYATTNNTNDTLILAVSANFTDTDDVTISDLSIVTTSESPAAAADLLFAVDGSTFSASSSATLAIFGETVIANHTIGGVATTDNLAGLHAIGGTDIVLGGFSLEAIGEDITFSTIRVVVTLTTMAIGEFTNLRIVEDDGTGSGIANDGVMHADELAAPLATVASPSSGNNDVSVTDTITSGNTDNYFIVGTIASSVSHNDTLDVDADSSGGTTATGVTSSVGVFLSGTSANATRTVTDTTAPTVVNHYSVDTDGDGDVDAIDVQFSEAILDSSVTVAEIELDNDSTNNATGEEVATGGSSTVTYPSSDSDANDEYYRFTLTDGSEISGSEAVYMHITGTSLTDANGVAIVAADNVGTPNDKAAPAPIGLQYVDNNNDGTVDGTGIQFSENISTNSAIVGDFTWTPNDITGSSLNTYTAETGGNLITFTLTGAPADTTSHSTAPTLAYTDGGGTEISDTAGNQVSTFTAQNVGDGAGPVLLSGSYQDANSDGTIDRIVLEYSEDTTFYMDANEWNFGIAGDMSMSGDFATGSAGCSGTGTSTITCTAGGVGGTFTADSDETGATVQPRWDYTSTGAVSDGTNLSASVNTTLTDDTDPILLSFTSTEADSTYGPTDIINITATYSENISSGSVAVVLNAHATATANLSSISTNKLSGNYTVGATGSGHNTTDLTVASISSQSVSDGTNANSTTIMPATNIADGSDIIVDTTAPVVNITAPLTTVKVNGSAVITFTDDDLTAAECSIDNAVWVACTTGVTTLADVTGFGALIEGAFTLYLRDTDTTGNIGTDNEAGIVKDTLAPTLTTVTIASDNADTTLAKTGDTITITITPSETITQPTVAFESGAVAVANATTYGGSWTAEYLADAADTDGIVTFTIDFTDTAGNNGTQVTAVTDATSVTFDTANPTVNTYSPADDASSVAINSNLVLTMDENVVVGTGNVVIYNSSDVLIETIDITSGLVVFDGTTGITINPTSDFAYSTGHYVQIDATAIEDAVGNTYAGIADKTTWNFTTAVAPAPAPAPSSGGGGGGGSSAPSAPATDSNTSTSSGVSNVVTAITKSRVYGRSLQLGEAMLTENTETGEISAELTAAGQITIKPNSKSTVSATIPPNTSITGSSDWDGKISPPLIKSTIMINRGGEEIKGKDIELKRDDVDVIVKIGSANNVTLSFSNPVKLEIPTDLPEGTRVRILFSQDGNKWEDFGVAVVVNGVLQVITDHFTYFAVSESLADKLGTAPKMPEFVGSTMSIFPDVSTTHANKVAIEYLKNNGIVAGYPDGTYQPTKTVNRAEFTKIIVEAKIGKNPVESAANCFPDVKASDWFASYVCYAKNNGILDGYPDGEFKPANTINLVEASKIFVNTLGVETITPQGGEWYSKFIESMVNSKYIPKTFSKLSESVRRGAMAEMTWRIMEKVKNQDAIDLAGLK